MEAHRHPHDFAERLVLTVLHAGAGWAALIDNLHEGLEGRDPWPSENPRDVLVDMVVGSVRVELKAVPGRDVEAAVELIDRAYGRVLADLRLATQIARRRASMGLSPGESRRA